MKLKAFLQSWLDDMLVCLESLGILEENVDKDIKEQELEEFVRVYNKAYNRYFMMRDPYNFVIDPSMESNVTGPFVVAQRID